MNWKDANLTRVRSLSEVFVERNFDGLSGEHNERNPGDMGQRVAPARPDSLPPWVGATLEALSGHNVAEMVILGGGIALKHYNDFRATQDIDAWWRDRPAAEDVEQLGEVMRQVAESHDYELSHRRWSQTDSYEFRDPGSRKKQFSFQISVRDVTLDPPTPSAWPPIHLETLRDNIGSKMNALVERGAARDFVDIYRIVHDGLLTSDECWMLYETKNPRVLRTEAAESILAHLIGIEGRRPLESIADAGERQAASSLRAWYHDVFLH
jgi:hypothetical protein